MNAANILQTIWSVLNSPAGIAAIAGLVLWLLNRLYAAKPAWARYEGTIIAAVRQAEKAIPDDTDNKSMAKLNNALQYVLRIYEQVEGKPASDSVKAELAEGIQILHNELQADGALE